MLISVISNNFDSMFIIVFPLLKLFYSLIQQLMCIQDVYGQKLFVLRMICDMATLTILSILLILNQLSLYGYFSYCLVGVFQFIASIVQYVKVYDYLEEQEQQKQNVSQLNNSQTIEIHQESTLTQSLINRDSNENQIVSYKLNFDMEKDQQNIEESKEEDYSMANSQSDIRRQDSEENLEMLKEGKSSLDSKQSILSGSTQDMSFRY
eukprot:403349093